MDNTYKRIIEDKQDLYSFIASVMPLATTPMSEEGAKAMKDYANEVSRFIDNLTPWKQSSKGGPRRDLASLRKTVKSGTTVVIPDDSDALAGSALYEDATILKR